MTGAAVRIAEPDQVLDREAVNAEYLARGLQWLRQLVAGDAGARDDRWYADPAFTDPATLPVLEELRTGLGLSQFETATLLLCAGVELDPLLVSTHLDGGGLRADDVTFALALSVLPEPAWDALSPYGPLRRWRLVEPVVGRGPLTAAPLRVDARVVNYLKGLNEPDHRLMDLLTVLPDGWGSRLVPSHEEVVEGMLRCWREPVTFDGPPVVQLVGSDQRVARQLAAAAAGRTGRACFELPPDRLATTSTEMTDLIALLDREAALLPAVLFVDVSELGEGATGTLRAVVEGTLLSVVVAGPEPLRLTRRRTRLLTARRPTLVEQQQLWQASLGSDDDLLAARLADHFDLDAGMVVDVAGRYATPGEALIPAAGDAVWDACRDQARPALTGLATLVEPQATWSDLVLAEPELRALRQFADQVRGRPTVLREWGMEEANGRGSGVTALFAGQSGTGKTLAAEVLAHDLRLTLCRIDLSGVVSKYIGETERNLRRVFDTAERGGVLLFFDEADALFGARSEVRDSHDRYANIEVNYLLQRMETFRGVAVLATNARSSMDKAFTRRLRTVVTFPFPAQAQRRQLWERCFPPATPVEALDLDRLAELPVTGAMVRTIALNTACCAAGRGTTVDMGLVLEMARAEFRKLDLPFTPPGPVDPGGGR